jgi:hypothetical protein
MEDHTPPEAGKSEFHCPHCNVYSSQKWANIKSSYGTSGRGVKQILDANIGYCKNCRDYTLWVGENMVYPSASSAPEPSKDMPEDVRKDFEEARQIVEESPKAAAALLRLAMEKLTQNLTGDDDGDLYHNIGDLVEEGRIDERVQKALDSVHVTGNDYVHAGEIYSPDDRETAVRLFELVNIIVRLTITREQLIEDAYSEVPESKKDGIEDRDGQ